MNCSLIIRVDRPLVGRPFGRKARWILRMACGAVHDSNSLEPPVSIRCDRPCKQTAPRRVRPPFDF